MNITWGWDKLNILGKECWIFGVVHNLEIKDKECGITQEDMRLNYEKEN